MNIQHLLPIQSMVELTSSKISSQNMQVSTTDYAPTGHVSPIFTIYVEKSQLISMKC